jgi:hypothetical protein
VPFPLAQLHLKRELTAKFADLLPRTTIEQQRRIRGRQDLIVRYNAERALGTLPQLLQNAADRKRLRTLLERVIADEGMRQLDIVPEQIRKLGRIREVLFGKTAPREAKPKTNIKRTRPAALQAA